MKRHIITKLSLACLCLGSLLTACEKDLEPYDNDGAWLNFRYHNWSEGGLDNLMQEDSYYSFALTSASLGVDLQQDTVWIEVETMGYLSDSDRTIELEQVPLSDEELQEYGEIEAVAGVHYVPFDDPDLLAKGYVPANSAVGRVPVVVLRDPSLDNQNAALRITFKDNGIFKPGYSKYNKHTIHIASRLSKPESWDLNWLDMNFVKYTETVHELLIQWSGNAWDDDYVKSIATSYDYLSYLRDFFNEKLEEVNAERQAQGLDILREPNGDPVKFEPKGF